MISSSSEENPNSKPMIFAGLKNTNQNQNMNQNQNQNQNTNQNNNNKNQMIKEEQNIHQQEVDPNFEIDLNDEDLYQINDEDDLDFSSKMINLKNIQKYIKEMKSLKSTSESSNFGNLLIKFDQQEERVVFIVSKENYLQIKLSMGCKIIKEDLSSQIKHFLVNIEEFVDSISVKGEAEHIILSEYSSGKIRIEVAIKDTSNTISHNELPVYELTDEILENYQIEEKETKWQFSLADAGTFKDHIQSNSNMKKGDDVNLSMMRIKQGPYGLQVDCKFQEVSQSAKYPTIHDTGLLDLNIRLDYNYKYIANFMNFFDKVKKLDFKIDNESSLTIKKMDKEGTSLEGVFPMTEFYGSDND